MYKCQLLPVRKEDQGLFSRFSAARLRTGCQLLQLSLFVAGKFNLAATHIHLRSWKNVRSHVNVHPPGFLNARSPEKENQRRFQLAFTVAVFGPGFASTNPEAKTMFDLSWTKQIDWINSLNLNCPMFFFFKCVDFVWFCWLLVVGPGLEIQLNLVGGKVYLQKKWFYNEREVLRFFWKGGEWGRWI